MYEEGIILFMLIIIIVIIIIIIIIASIIIIIIVVVIIAIIVLSGKGGKVPACCPPAGRQQVRLRAEDNPPPLPRYCFAAHTEILVPLPHTDALASLGVTFCGRGIRRGGGASGDVVEMRDFP